MRSRIYRLQMKHRRANSFDVEKLSDDTEAILADYEIPVKRGYTEHGENEELEAIADVWAFVAENIEREEWKSYTREDWADLERQHVERAEYTEPDLYDDILTEYEAGNITAEEAQAKAKEYRACEYRFCLNVFQPRRRDQRYCPDSDCRRREANAKIRYEKIGTYLPAYVYKDNRDDTDERHYEKFETSRDMEKDGDMYSRFILKDLYGGIRDRQREAYLWMQVTEKDLKDSSETALKRHENPVISEEIRSAI